MKQGVVVDQFAGRPNSPYKRRRRIFIVFLSIGRGECPVPGILSAGRITMPGTIDGTGGLPDFPDSPYKRRRRIFIIFFL